jgi:hypothetical protein
VRRAAVSVLGALALLLAPSGAAAKSRPLYWGAWIGPQLSGGEAPWDMRAAHRFEVRVGKGLSLLEFSAPFAECDERRCEFFTFPTAEMAKIRRHGAIPLFSWNSGASGGDPKDFQLRDLRAGRFDSHIRDFARAARDWGHPFFLRFDWEMNGSWFSWGADTNGNQPGEFVAAWRHVHRIFDRAGGENATWVWCPYASDQSLRPFYPGDGYVDWTCLDGYNWGPDSSEPAPWRSFAEIFAPAYRRVAGHVAPGKPMLIAELASSGAPEEKAAWVRDMFDSLQRGFGKVHGLVWFDKADGENDWPLESSPPAVEAFGQGLRSGFKENVFSRLGRSPIPPPR